MKHIINLLKICSILFFFVAQNVFSEENKIIKKDHEWNFYSGMFGIDLEEEEGFGLDIQCG